MVKNIVYLILILSVFMSCTKDVEEIKREDFLKEMTHYTMLN